jgi:hypothetical protein
MNGTRWQKLIPIWLGLAIAAAASGRRGDCSDHGQPEPPRRDAIRPTFHD